MYKRQGFKPIVNLSGHLIEHYKVHGGLSIPNIWAPGTQELKAGQIYAIEPFVTTAKGAGMVRDGRFINIYSIIARKRLRDRGLNDLLDELWVRFKTLPFTPRYLPDGDVKAKIDRLVKIKALRAYPVLIEARGEVVAQAEHTIVVTENGSIVLTQ